MKTATYDWAKNCIVLRFLYDTKLIMEVKKLAGRKFHSVAGDKFWTCLPTHDNRNAILALGFKLIETELPVVPEPIRRMNRVQTLEFPEGLFPYQREGADFVESRNGRALIADSMGLGKTAQAIAWWNNHREIEKTLVVCPSSIKINWEREFRKWGLRNTKTTIVYGQQNRPLPSGVVIINYDLLSHWSKTIFKWQPQLAIFDECHYLKNHSAKRTKTAIQLCHEIPKIIALSGTPIVNRPIEFYNIIKILDPKLFPNRFEFGKRFCKAHLTRFGWDMSGASNTQELHEILRNTIMIRRNKEDVLPQLPKKHRVVVPMEMTQDYAEEYAEAQSDFLTWLSDISAMKAKNAAKAEALVKVEYLKTLAMRGKIKQSLEWIRDFLESEGPLVLFVNHRDAGRIIHEHFKDVSGLIDGSTPIAQRQQIVDDFQSGKIKLLVGNIKAAGVGITLTRASNVCIFELPWSPGDLEQAIDRVHRIGQTAAEVWTWVIVAVNTIEEKIAAILDSKKEILNSVLDGRDSESNDTLMALLEQLDK